MLGLLLNAVKIGNFWFILFIFVGTNLVEGTTQNISVPDVAENKPHTRLLVNQQKRGNHA